MAKRQDKSKKGLPKRTGKRKGKRAAYYEVTYPLRKLRRMYRTGYGVASLRTWADSYKSPSGLSGVGLLVRLGKEKGLNLNQVG